MPLLKSVRVTLTVDYEITDRQAVFAAAAAMFDDPNDPRVRVGPEGPDVRVTWVVLDQLIGPLSGLEHIQATGVNAVGL